MIKIRNHEGHKIYYDAKEKMFLAKKGKTTLDHQYGLEQELITHIDQTIKNQKKEEAEKKAKQEYKNLS